MKGGQFFDAGRTPGRPEIQDEELAAEIRAGDPFPGIGGDRKARRGIAFLNNSLLKRVPDRVKKAGEENGQKREQDPVCPGTTHLH
jgi:hypothetical protein